MALLLGSVASAQPIPYLTEVEGAGTVDAQLRFVWGTQPGVRYLLEASPDLINWQPADGFPRASATLADEFSLLLSDSPVFLRVSAVDEQPPTVVRTSPADLHFAVSTVTRLQVELDDPAGVDPASLSISVGSHGPYTLADAQLTWADPILTLDLGPVTALGAPGETVSASVTAADTVGNPVQFNWSFDLAAETIVADDVFVFGSPAAAALGQQVAASPTRTMAQRLRPPTKASHPNQDWSLTSVASDRLIVAYTGATAPPLAVDALVCNFAPQRADEVFYRRVTAVQDDTATKTLTLLTEDVSLGEFLPQASLSLSDQSAVYELAEDGTILPPTAEAWEGGLAFPTLGLDLSGSVLFSAGPLTLSWAQAYWLFSPSLYVALETESISLRRLEMRLDGALRSALAPQLVYANGFSGAVPIPLFNRQRVVFLGLAGPVPVWVRLGFDLSASIDFYADVTATLSTGIRQNFDLSFGARYDRDAPSTVEWIRRADLRGPTLLPLTYEINGAAGASVALIPKFDLRVVSLAGLSASTNPRIGVEGEATIVDDELTDAIWTLFSRADLELGLSVVGLDESLLPPPTSITLYGYEWSEIYPSELEIRQQPSGVTVEVGQTAHLSVDAIGPKPVTYQWYQENRPLPGQNQSQLLLRNIQLEGGGNFFVRLMDGLGDTLDSQVAFVEVLPPAIPGFALIAAGEFSMGDSRLAGTPVHTVSVSTFYMAKHEVTNGLWNEVRAWGLANGYLDLAASLTFVSPAPLEYHPDHPVRFVSWYDAVKFCNAMSEREGLTPCYYTDEGEVLRASFQPVEGEPAFPTPVVCDWTANGYRLPTEAEWEKAARGGQPGRRFPWGNTITHSDANYFVETWPGTSDNRHDFDASPTQRGHPDTIYSSSNPDGETSENFFTLPVGSFEPNDYGLYDVTGNIGELCWDYFIYNSYGSSPREDPIGPPPFNVHTARVIRGGSWASNAQNVMVGARGNVNHFSTHVGGAGFRLARRP